MGSDRHAPDVSGTLPSQVAAFLPATGRFVDEEEEEDQRSQGSLQNPKISLTDPKKVRGLHIKVTHMPRPMDSAHSLSCYADMSTEI